MRACRIAASLRGGGAAVAGAELAAVDHEPRAPARPGRRRRAARRARDPRERARARGARCARATSPATASRARRGRSAPASATRRSRARARDRRAGRRSCTCCRSRARSAPAAARAPAAICSASSNAADIAPNVPIGVAPPGGITTASRSRRAIRHAANGTSTTRRSRTSWQPRRDQRAAVLERPLAGGCGNTIAPASSPARARVEHGRDRVVRAVRADRPDPRAPRARAWPSQASSVRILLPP